VAGKLGKGSCSGEIIAGVAALTEAIAVQAAALIEVGSEPLPAVTDSGADMEPGNIRVPDTTATPVGSFSLASTGGWQTWKTVPANISTVTGTHTVYLTFSSGQPADFVNINWFTFSH